ncbi:DsrE family protein [Oscillibacter sp.]|uniref:DsrE family protein n=1 Tax=Oscillibacter sp. TaxID=1945593 RepID=UPI0028A77F82|nr:DsrE family protein [Oscillibacter sp.]
MKVLFHVNKSAHWKTALGNILNMLQYGEENSMLFEIELVANGPAVKELQPSAAKSAGIYDQLERFATALRICACNNSLVANGITPSMLLPFIQVVPAGVVEIAVRQLNGYAYIKP